LVKKHLSEFQVGKIWNITILPIEPNHNFILKKYIATFDEKEYPRNFPNCVNWHYVDN